MAYFLKQTKLKGRTYLAIYESFYSHEKKGTAHRTYRSLGSVETLKKNGMEDPVSYYKEEVVRLNRERQDSGKQKISDETPLLYLGYFLLKSILEKLDIKRYVDLFRLTNPFDYDLYEVLSSLVFARAVSPCSKLRTFHEVLPRLYEKPSCSYDQLLSALAFLGSNYEKFIEIFTGRTREVYGSDASKTYFDCTNFYFEIDREDDFRRKGPSKENRKDPIVGLGLLLDRDQVPIGMKMYPGNQSEKPVLREVIQGLKKKNGISGRTIHVADKGLNCAQNIAFSKKNGDGYLFSKSVKMLPETEKTWILLDEGSYRDVKDKDGRLLYRCKSCIEEFPYVIESEGQLLKIRLTEKRLATYNPELAAKKRYEINRLAEKARAMTSSKAAKEEYGEAAKYVQFRGKGGEKAVTQVNEQAIEKDLRLAGYNLLVTSETDMPDADIYRTYHNLWRIEESFRIMKSDLDARPVFVQKEETIKGHFLICYLTVLLERLLEFRELGNVWSASDIFRFLKGFQAVRAESRYINTTPYSGFIAALEDKYGLPLTDYFLSETQLRSIMNLRLKKKTPTANTSAGQTGASAGL